jgi:hypothetical protein
VLGLQVCTITPCLRVNQVDAINKGKKPIWVKSLFGFIILALGRLVDFFILYS